MATNNVVNDKSQVAARLSSKQLQEIGEANDQFVALFAAMVKIQPSHPYAEAIGKIVNQNDRSFWCNKFNHEVTNRRVPHAFSFTSNGPDNCKLWKCTLSVTTDHRTEIWTSSFCNSKMDSKNEAIFSYFHLRPSTPNVDLVLQSEGWGYDWFDDQFDEDEPDDDIILILNSQSGSGTPSTRPEIYPSDPGPSGVGVMPTLPSVEPPCAESVATGSTVAANHETKAYTSRRKQLVDQAPTDMGGYARTPVKLTRNLRSFGDRPSQFPDFTDRWMPLSSFIWNESDTTGKLIKTFDLPNDLNAAGVKDLNSMPFTAFQYVRPTIEILIKLTSIQAQAGRIIAGYRYFNLVSGLPGEIGYVTDARELVQSDHCILNAGTTSNGALSIPFYNPLDMVSTLQSQWWPSLPYATLCIGVLSPLKTGLSHNVANVDVYYRFANSKSQTEFYGQRSIISLFSEGNVMAGHLNSSMNDKFGFNPGFTGTSMSDAANMLGDKFSGLINALPGASTLFNAAAGASEVIDDMADDLMQVPNGDRPNFMEEPLAVQPWMGPNKSSMAGTTQIRNLASYPSTRTMHHPAIIESVPNECTINYLKGVWGYLSSYTIPSTYPAGRAIAVIPITPLLYQFMGHTEGHKLAPGYGRLTPVGYIASMYEYYAGDLELRLSFIKTPMHNLRVRVVVSPTMDYSPSCPSTVYQVGDETDFVHVLPFLAPAKIAPLMDTVSCGTTPMNYGFATIIVESPLTYSDIVASEIELMLYLRGAANWQPFVPGAVAFRQYVQAPAVMELQSESTEARTETPMTAGVADPARGIGAAMMIGEHVDIIPLLKRFSFYHEHTLAFDALEPNKDLTYRLLVQAGSAGTRTDGAKYDKLSLFHDMFRGYRGSMRYHIHIGASFPALVQVTHHPRAAEAIKNPAVWPTDRDQFSMSANPLNTNDSLKYFSTGRALETCHYPETPMIAVNVPWYTNFATNINAYDPTLFTSNKGLYTNGVLEVKITPDVPVASGTVTVRVYRAMGDDANLQNFQITPVVRAPYFDSDWVTAFSDANKTKPWPAIAKNIKAIEAIRKTQHMLNLSSESGEIEAPAFDNSPRGLRLALSEVVRTMPPGPAKKDLRSCIRRMILNERKLERKRKRIGLVLNSEMFMSPASAAMGIVDTAVKTGTTFVDFFNKTVPAASPIVVGAAATAASVLPGGATAVLAAKAASTVDEASKLVDGMSTAIQGVTQITDTINDQSLPLVNGTLQNLSNISASIGNTITNLPTIVKDATVDLFSLLSDWVKEKFAGFTEINYVSATMHLYTLFKGKTWDVKAVSIIGILSVLGFITVDTMADGLIYLMELVSDSLSPVPDGVQVLSSEAPVPEPMPSYVQWIKFLLASIAGICGFASARTKVDGFMAAIKSTLLVANSVERLFKDSITYITSFIAWVTGTQNPEVAAMEALKAQSDQMGQWATKVAALCAPGRIEEIATSNPLIKEVIELYEQGSQYLLYVHQAPSIRPVFTNLFNMCKTTYDAVAHRVGNSITPEPVSIYMWGSPGTGKSTAMSAIGTKVGCALGLVSSSNPVYERNCAAKYWDGYYNQPIVLIDEVGAVKDPETVSAFVADIFGLKSPTNYTPNFAAVADKSRIVSARLLLMCSNFGYPTFAECRDHSAFWRRRDILIQCELSEWFKSKYPNAANASDPGITVEHIREMREKNIHLKFRFQDPNKVDSTIFDGPGLTYDQMLDQTVALATTKAANYKWAAAKREEEVSKLSPTAYANAAPNLPPDVRNAVLKALETSEQTPLERHEASSPPSLTAAEAIAFLRECQLRPEAPEFKSATELDEITLRIREIVAKKTVAQQVEKNERDAEEIAKTAPKTLISEAPQVCACTFAVDGTAGVGNAKMNDMASLLIAAETPSCPHAWGLQHFDYCEVHEQLILPGTSMLALASREKMSAHPDLTRWAMENCLSLPVAPCQATDCPMNGLGKASEYWESIVDRLYRSPYAGAIRRRLPPLPKTLQAPADPVAVLLGETLIDKISRFSTNILDYVLPAAKKIITICSIMGGIWLLLSFFYPQPGVVTSTLFTLDTIASQTGPYTKTDDPFSGAFSKRSPPINVKSQSGSVQLDHLLNRNHLKIYFSRPDGTFGAGSKIIMGLGVCGRTFVSPSHMWKESRPRVGLVLHTRGSEMVALDFAWEDLKIVRVPNVDLCLVTVLNRRLPVWKDIRGLFPQEREYANIPYNGTFYNFNYDKGLAPITKIYCDKVTSIDTRFYSGNFHEQYALVGYMYPASKPGFCGNILFNEHCGKIMGMHIAGDGKMGFCNILPRSLFSDLTAIDVEIPKPDLPVEPRLLRPEGTYIPVGTLAKHEYITPSGKTSIVKSACFGVLGEPSRLPPVYRNPGDSFVGSTILNDGVNKQCNPAGAFPLKDLQTVAAASREEILVLARPIVAARKRTVEEAVCGVPGVPFMQAIRRNTSPGYPLNVEFKGSSKSTFLVMGPGNTTLEALHPRLLEIFNQDLALRKKGIIPATPYFDFIKDERTRPGKMPHLINGCPFSEIITWKIYTMDFFAAYQNARFELSHAIGINVRSLEWTKLVQHLSEVNSRVVTGDYKGFGQQLNAAIILDFGDTVNAWYKKHDPHWKPEDDVVRSTLFEGIAFCYHVAGDYFFQDICGAPSGNPNTAPINSEVNKCYIRLAWLDCFRGTSVASLAHFRRYVRLITYGDDLIMSVHPSLISRFNNKFLLSFFARYNIIYTDAHKHAPEDTEETCDIVDATFLKHSFIPHPERSGIWMAALDKTVVQDIPSFIHAPVMDETAQSLVNCDQAARQAYGWGPAYHKSIRSALLDFWAVRGEYLNTPTWEDLDEVICSGEGDKTELFGYSFIN